MTRRTKRAPKGCCNCESCRATAAWLRSRPRTTAEKKRGLRHPHRPGSNQSHNQSQETPMMNYKTLVAAASLMSMALPSSAFAQCTECAIYPDRDPLNKLEKTPASKMGLEQPGGAAALPNAAVPPSTANTVNNPNNARAEMRGHYSQRPGRGIGVNRTKKLVRSPDGRYR